MFCDIRQPLDDNKLLIDVGYTCYTAKPQSPATVGLVYKQDGKIDSIPSSIPFTRKDYLICITRPLPVILCKMHFIANN